MSEQKKPVLKKWWFYPAAILLLMATALAGLFVCVAVNASKMDNPMPADVIIVLGARIDEAGEPLPALERRLDRALSLYESGYADTFIVTGAQGADEPQTEASAMAGYLAARGVPLSQILLEDQSYNTQQNLSYAKMIMEERGLVTAIVVSSDYHLWRALSICDDLGIEATGAGSQNALTLPVTIKNWLQESASWVKYILTRWV